MQIYFVSEAVLMAVYICGNEGGLINVMKMEDKNEEQSA